MKVRIEFEDGDDCSSFSVVEFRRSYIDTDEDRYLAIQAFLSAMDLYRQEDLIAEIVTQYFASGDDKTIDKAFEKVGLKIIDAS